MAIREGTWVTWGSMQVLGKVLRAQPWQRGAWEVLQFTPRSRKRSARLAAELGEASSIGKSVKVTGAQRIESWEAKEILGDDWDKFQRLWGRF